MAKFPSSYCPSFEAFHRGYQTHLQEAQASVDVAAVAHAAALIEDMIRNDRTIFVCGNGGSAAIANHLEVDFAKGIATETNLKPRIVSLCRTELITAYANDNDYSSVFWRQLEKAARLGDLLITMSVSGLSDNIVDAVYYFANKFHGSIISMTGDVEFYIELPKLSAVHIRINNSDNYGIGEGMFETIMHEIAQYIRQANMDHEEIPETKF